MQLEFDIAHPVFLREPGKKDTVTLAGYLIEPGLEPETLCV